MVADRLVVVGCGELIRESSIDDLLASSMQRSIVHTTDDARLQQALHQRQIQHEQLGPHLAVEYCDQLPDPRALSQLCRDLDLLVLELHQDRTSLEELFLQMTDASSEYRSEN